MNDARPILLLVQDLFFRAKIEATARAAGVAVRCVADASKLAPEEFAVERFAGCMVDLESAGAGSLSVLSTVAATLSTVAFFSHVRADLAALAQGAGCAEVLSRSQLSSELPQILRRLAGVAA